MDHNEDQNEVQHPNSTPEHSCVHNYFSPISLLSVWHELGKTTKSITLAIVFPSAVNAEAFTIKVIEDGDVSELSVDWHNPLIEYHFTKKCLLIHESVYTYLHHKLLGFEATLGNLSQNLKDKVASVAHIGSELYVQSHIVIKSIIVYIDDNTRLLYLQLKALEEI